MTADNEVYKEMAQLVQSTKYLFRNNNILNCFRIYGTSFTNDNDLTTLNSCLTNTSIPLSPSDYRHLNPIFTLADIGSSQNVKLDGFTRQTLAQIIGTNKILETSNKNSLIDAINEVYQASLSGVPIAGNGLTSSGTTVNVGAGNGITVNENDIAINFTGVSTDGSTTPTSLAQVIGSIDIGGGTLTDAIKTLQTSNAGKLDTAGAGLTSSGTTVSVGAGNGINVNENDVALAPTAAGAGLTYTSGILAIGAGNGIAVTSDTVEINRAANSGLAFIETQVFVNNAQITTASSTSNGATIVIGGNTITPSFARQEFTSCITNPSVGTSLPEIVCCMGMALALFTTAQCQNMT